MIKRLKSLELQGFKTFATITRLEFPGQITAIVGPNGSGKSNIADSIRWVLGEQSYSLLRAKRTEDMIFSGSQQKPRAGMALTSIIFNNDDGWLPIDFSEVSISRRAYRDGQNEYLLNGQKIRLKDISELLSQTGLSECTYTIIGQGLVDVALALRPDERRKLFEEAAGIGLYRSRKEESLRRLENTRKNLDRIKDILTEIRPRLRSLERQSERFEKYKRMQSDLKVLLQEWYGFHWYQKQQDLRNARSAYQDQEKRLNSLRLKNAEAEGKVNLSRNELQKNRSASETAHRELAEFHKNLEQTSREFAILEERQNSYIHQKSNLEIDIAHAEEEIKELESQQQHYQKEIDLRTTDYNSASEELGKIERKQSTVFAKKTAIEVDLKKKRDERITLETEKVKVSARNEEYKSRLNTLDNEKIKIDQAISSLGEEKEKIGSQVNLLLNKIAAMGKGCSDIADRLKARTDDIEDVKKERQELDHKLSIFDTHMAKSQAQLEVLVQAEAALSGYSEGSKTVVEESRKGRLPAGIEPFSKYLLVDEKYAKAIGAALGEFSDLLIMPFKGEDTVIEYLESRENDRVALLSEGQKKSVEHDRNFTKISGFIGYADELIEVDSKYRNLAEILFSEILIVEDKRSALKIQPLLAENQKAVTLTGLVMQANGIVISGQTASGKKIGRTRRQGEIRDELSRIEQDVIRISDERHKLDAMISDQEQALELGQQQLAEAEEERNQLQQTYQGARDSHTRLVEQFNWHNDRTVKINESRDEAQKSIKSGEEHLKKISVQINTKIDEEKRLVDKVNTFPVFEIQQELNQWQTHRIVAENALKTAKQRFQEHQERFADAQQRLATYQTRMAGVISELSKIDQTKGGLKSEIEKVNDNIEIIQKDRIEPLKVEGGQAEKSVSALEKLMEHSHQQVIIAERQFTQLQLELDRRNDQLEHLQERIEDDFGLVTFDYDNKIDGRTPLPFDGGLVENLPKVMDLRDGIDDEIKRLKAHLRHSGSINQEAQQEYFEVKERFEFLTEQIQDLEKASKDLQAIIDELDTIMERDFIKTFYEVDKEFSVYFTRLFNGGEAKLLFSDEEQPVEGGVDIEARLPGRRRQGLALLSGGERSLTAVALIFALLKVSPTPFCILDEVDAMLDESNVGRFIDLLKELSQNTQFVVITHNRNTVQAADVIYGVTMGRDSTSQMISLKLEEVDDTYLE